MACKRSRVHLYMHQLLHALQYTEQSIAESTIYWSSTGRTSHNFGRTYILYMILHTRRTRPGYTVHTSHGTKTENNKASERVDVAMWGTKCTYQVSRPRLAEGLVRWRRSGRHGRSSYDRHELTWTVGSHVRGNQERELTNYELAARQTFWNPVCVYGRVCMVQLHAKGVEYMHQLFS